MNLDKINELNELGSDVEHNLPRMKELAHDIVEALNMPNPKNEGYEYDYLRICEHGLQRETCYKCLFENNCRLDKSYLSMNE